MTESDARDWLARAVPRETFAKIEHFVALVVAENANQNLISTTTMTQIWARHVVDSAQLVGHAQGAASWVDLGSGPGFPGIVLGLMTGLPTTLIEVRARRVVFLSDVVAELNASNIRVVAAKVEAVTHVKAEAITARAFAPLERLFATAAHLAAPGAQWVLPKGRSARSELETATRTWQGVFHVEPSITDTDAAIILATDVRRK